MGGCCARQQDIYFDRKNSFQYSTDEIIKINAIVKPELRFYIKKDNKRVEDIQLSKIINILKNIYPDKTNTITEIELFNLAIYNKESFINNDYLVFDMRKSSEQKEEYLKRLKHINYTYEQIKNIEKINKLEILKNFIDKRKIILIISEYYLNPDNNKEGFKKVENYPLEICNLLYNINDSICFKILNTWFNKNEESTNKFEEYLSVFLSYDIVPFILLAYLHVTTFYKEGYFFISFLNQQIFYLENYINYLNKFINNKDGNGDLNEFNLKNKFISDMNITCIILIDNNCQSKFEIKDYQYQDKIFKEIILNKNDIKTKKENFLLICDWIKQEIKNGNSCYINIENLDISQQNITINNSWIFVIIVLITIITEVEYFSVINYLKEKMIYIDNISELINNNVDKEEIIKILSYLNK